MLIQTKTFLSVFSHPRIHVCDTRLFIKQKCKWKYLRNDIARHLGCGYNVIFACTTPTSQIFPQFLCLFIMILQLYLNNIIDFSPFKLIFFRLVLRRLRNLYLPPFAFLFLHLSHFLGIASTTTTMKTTWKDDGRHKKYGWMERKRQNSLLFSCHRRNFCIRIMDIYIA